MEPVAISEWVGLRAFARRCGRRHRAAQKAIQDGRIPASAVRRDAKGRIVGVEVNEARRAWIEATDPCRSPVPLTDGPAPAPVHTSGRADVRDRAPSADESAAACNTDQARYLAARAEREEVALRRDKLDHLERLGLLVSAAAVEQEIAEIFGEVKSNVFRIADRRAQALAAEPDPARVHRLLTDEFRMVFDEQSRRLAADAAGGAERNDTAPPSPLTPTVEEEKP